jgi:hypothetical protein
LSHLMESLEIGVEFVDSEEEGLVGGMVMSAVRSNIVGGSGVIVVDDDDAEVEWDCDVESRGGVVEDQR